MIGHKQLCNISGYKEVWVLVPAGLEGIRSCSAGVSMRWQGPEAQGECQHMFSLSSAWGFLSLPPWEVPVQQFLLWLLLSVVISLGRRTLLCLAFNSLEGNCIECKSFFYLNCVLITCSFLTCIHTYNMYFVYSSLLNFFFKLILLKWQMGKFTIAEICCLYWGGLFFHVHAFSRYTSHFLKCWVEVFLHFCSWEQDVSNSF